jgi:hypothetical protein
VSKIPVCLDTSQNPTFATGSAPSSARATHAMNELFLTKAWAMKVAHEGQRSTFSLGAPNKAAAAAAEATSVG